MSAETRGDLRIAVEAVASREDAPVDECRDVVGRLLDALERGDVRAAEPHDGGWTVHGWVKAGLLLGFRIGINVESSAGGSFHFRDRDIFPTQNPHATGRNVRVVPGGTTIRRGAFLGDGVVVMPPAYVNVGAYVAQGAMIDSHALVGSCAQIGRGVHLSAAAQIGGVLEPVGAMPVIVEDGAFVGGGCGVYEGVSVGAGAVLAPGVILSGATPIHDVVRGELLRGGSGSPLVVPRGAVVVPGSRPAAGKYAMREGLHLQTPVIVKYRDSGTEAALALEAALR